MSEKVSPITPTVGRVVLVRGSSVNPKEPGREYPALVTAAHGQNCVNVDVSNEKHGGVCLSSVHYCGDAEQSIVGAAWRWMPYQVQTAAKESQGLKQAEPLTPAQRVHLELNDLLEKISKLSAFAVTEAFRGLSHEHQQLLDRQADDMRAYSRTLQQRLALFAKEGA